jgi:2-haloacid dehalogenase
VAGEGIKALTFDVFGTVVDWRSGIVRELRKAGEHHGVKADWEALADRWRAAYRPAMDRVRHGELPWTDFHDLHLITLDESLAQEGIDGFDHAAKNEVNLAWRRLDPWPDVVEGLTRLRKRYIVSTLSNGSVAQLVEMSKYGGLTWDCVLSAELWGHYKPDPQLYLSAAKALDAEPSQVMMVAAHPYDLESAAHVGFKTAFVRRKLEWGQQRAEEAPDFHAADVVAADFLDLARQLGA